MSWFSRKAQVPPQRLGETSEADRAIQDSAKSKDRAESRWDGVREATDFLTHQLETNHLAERLEAAMTLKGHRS